MISRQMHDANRQAKRILQVTGWSYEHSELHPNMMDPVSASCSGDTKSACFKVFTVNISANSATLTRYEFTCNREDGHQLKLKLHIRRPMIGVEGCGSISHGKKIQVSCDTSVTKVSTNGRPAGLA